MGTKVVAEYRFEKNPFDRQYHQAQQYIPSNDENLHHKGIH